MDILHIVSFVAGAVAAAVPLLTVIVKHTKTQKDDEVLAWVEKVLPFLPKDAPKPPASVAPRPVSIDHRK